ncbi:DUF4062 domain-containing protein [Rhizobium brockwellii]|uniref:DUF4062 domain-containing protein n=1 Tax=Rhizobium brockwellii TaxID=3019932 RepID=A0ABU3YGW2_9HYPH|nr:DUF4062 domain-containing protein [Rhizobium brockwellii]MDV4178104.1 DUF4062 domain-containing protein [Rhizobium brockwellii]MDV4185103.1 DUF4062 domain-containing protein [Rhizobium brockwellii]
MEKRYQVFVSSTFRDLEAERQEVMHALLEMDCLPAGMELFPAANEEQWDLIKKVIDDSDYYVLIVGGRYGSTGPEGLSYTEMEYRYALSIDKPTIAFLHRDPGNIVSAKSENSEEGQKKLAAFREFVEKKLCKYWATPQELGSVVSRLLKLTKSTPAVGWVRANELADRDATAELLRLRRQMDDLKRELESVRTSAPKGAERLSQGSETHLIEFTYKARRPMYNDLHLRYHIDLSWDDVFACCAPTMIHEVDEQTLKVTLSNFIRDKAIPQLQNTYDGLQDASLREFMILEEDFQTVKIQLRALGLIIKSEKQRSVKDTSTYWTLTPYGDEVMTRLRAIPTKSGENDPFSGTPLALAQEG